MKRLALWLGAPIAIGAAVSCSPSRAESRSPAEPPIVAVARVSRGDIARVLTLAAEFRPYQEIDVHAKVAGYVKSIGVDVGDRVKAGDLLAVLEIPELQDDLQQAEASVKRANEEVNRAEADAQRAASAHESVHLAAERLTAVSKARPKLIAQQDLDEAAGRDRVAEAQVSTAKAAVASAREQLEMAKTNVAKSKTLLGYSRITAPFAGVITHRYADTGAMIQAGTSSQTQAMPIVKLTQNDRLRLVMPIPESAVSRIRLKQPVDVRVDALGKTFPGTVARFADRLDADTRTMRVEVDVENKSFELVPGMYAQASVPIEKATDVLTVPVQAVDREGESARVMAVARDGTIDERAVTIGLETGDRVEVTRGLNAGELVVIGNRGTLKPKMPVTPKEVAPAVEGTR